MKVLIIASQFEGHTTWLDSCHPDSMPLDQHGSLSIHEHTLVMYKHNINKSGECNTHTLHINSCKSAWHQSSHRSHPPHTFQLCRFRISSCSIRKEARGERGSASSWRYLYSKDVLFKAKDALTTREFGQRTKWISPRNTYFELQYQWHHIPTVVPSLSEHFISYSS